MHVITRNFPATGLGPARTLWFGVVVALIGFGSPAWVQATTQRLGGESVLGGEMPKDLVEGEAKPIDLDAELAEIARAKALVRSLSGAQELAGAKGDVKAAATNPAVSGGGSAVAGNQAGQAQVLGNDLASAMRGLAAEGSSIIKSLTGSDGGAKVENAGRRSNPGESGAHRAGGSGQSAGAQPDPERYRALFDKLFEEILPWAIALLAMCGIMFGAKVWYGAKMSRASAKRRSGSGRSRRGRSRSRRSESSQDYSQGPSRRQD